MELNERRKLEAMWDTFRYGQYKSWAVDCELWTTDIGLPDWV